MKRKQPWFERHAVVLLSLVVLLIGALVAILVLSLPAEGGGDRVLSTITSIITIAAFIVAVGIYLAQRSDSRLLTEGEMADVTTHLNAATDKRGQAPDRSATVIRRSLVDKRILWVDDRPQNCIDEVLALREAGASVTFVLTTREGEAALISRDYDAIVSDMSRPEGKLAGYDLLSFANEVAGGVPFIFYTGTATPDQVAEARQRGAFAQVNVPWELYRSVTKALLRA